MNFSRTQFIAVASGLKSMLSVSLAFFSPIFDAIFACILRRSDEIGVARLAACVHRANTLVLSEMRTCFVFNFLLFTIWYE